MTTATEFDAAAVEAYVGNTSADADTRRRATFAATGNAEAEYQIEQADKAREWEVVRTVRKAAEIGCGWEGNHIDAMHLARTLKRLGAFAP